MKIINNKLETRFRNKTIRFGECFSPYATEEIALLKKYKRQGGVLDTKTMWKSIEEDCAKYILAGEVAEHPKSPWDIKTKNQNGKTEFYEVRSCIFSRAKCGINFSSSGNHTAHKGREAQMALEDKWRHIDGYLICDSEEYSTKGFFRWWKIPVKIIKELYTANTWHAFYITAGGQTKPTKASQWTVSRSTACFRQTMSNLFNNRKTQIHF